jgi:head-tail adaptor
MFFYSTRSVISEMRNRIILCSQDDVIDDNGMMRLTRQGIAKSWANIEAIDTTVNSSIMTRDGYESNQKSNTPTHKITIRSRREINISMAAWIYEERRKSSPRWYKVTSATEDDPYTRINARLWERSDSAIQPQLLATEKIFDPAMELPEGIDL